MWHTQGLVRLRGKELAAAAAEFPWSFTDVEGPQIQLETVQMLDIGFYVLERPCNA